MQIIITSLGLTIAGSILGRLPVIGGLLSSVLGIAGLVIWVMLLIKTYQGEWYELPYIGEWAKNIAGI